MIQACKILKSNGTDGGILLGGPGEGIDLIDELIYLDFDGLLTPFFVADLTPKGTGRAIAHITDVECLADAEEIVGKAVYVDAEAQEEDTVDFDGWCVFDHGRPVGIAGAIEPIPGNPCLYVGDALVPLHEDFIESIDAEAKELRLRLPEGLL